MQDKIIEATEDSMTIVKKMPGNESAQHFLLKNVAAFWLRQNDCVYVGTEIFLGKENNNGKTICDVVGIDDRWNRKTRKRTANVKMVEVKISRADFQSGYCASGNYNYIICPPGLITEKDVPAGVGLLWCDLTDVRFSDTGRLLGVKSIKKARKRSTEGQKMAPISVMRSMLHNSTNRNTFENNWLDYIVKYYD